MLWYLKSFTIINQGTNNLTKADFDEINDNGKAMSYIEALKKLEGQAIVLANAILHYCVDACVYYIVCLHHVWSYFSNANQVDIGPDLHRGPFHRGDVPGPHNGYCSDPVINVSGEDHWSADIYKHCFVNLIIKWCWCVTYISKCTITIKHIIHLGHQLIHGRTEIWVCNSIRLIGLCHLLFYQGPATFITTCPDTMFLMCDCIWAFLIM